LAYIKEMASGNWQVVARHQGIRPVAKSFKTKTEAARSGRLLKSEIHWGIFVDRAEAQRLILGERIDRYLAEVTPRSTAPERPEKVRVR
jgi:hypothetical protein